MLKNSRALQTVESEKRNIHGIPPYPRLAGFFLTNSTITCPQGHDPSNADRRALWRTPTPQPSNQHLLRTPQKSGPLWVGSIVGRPPKKTGTPRVLGCSAKLASGEPLGVHPSYKKISPLAPATKSYRRVIAQATNNLLGWRNTQVAVGQNQWYHFGVGEFITHFRTYFSGWIESDVHRGYDLGLTHGQVGAIAPCIHRFDSR